MLNNITDTKNYSKVDNLTDDKCQDVSLDDNCCLSAETIVSAKSENSILNGRSRSSSGSSLYKTALKVSMFFSILSSVTPHVLKQSEIVSIALMKLSLKYNNMKCLIKNVLIFGEKNLASSRIDVRSELGRIGTKLETLMSRNYGAYLHDHIEIYSMDKASTNYYIEKMEREYSATRKAVLSICEKVKSTSTLDIQARHQLGNLSELIRKNDFSYHHCQDINIGKGLDIYSRKRENSMDTEKTTILIIVLMTFFALLYFFILASRKIRAYKNRRKINQRGNLPSPGSNT